MLPRSFKPSKRGWKQDTCGDTRRSCAHVVVAIKKRSNEKFKPSHPLRKVSEISIQPFAGLMALTSFLLASPPLSPSVLLLRSCSSVFVSDIVHTHGSLSGRRMLRCFVGSPLLLCEGSLSNLSVGSCRSLFGDFCVPLATCVS